MVKIKDAFFRLAPKSKLIDYYYQLNLTHEKSYSDCFTREAYSSGILGGNLVFFHYLQNIFKIQTSDPSARLSPRLTRHLYYFGPKCHPGQVQRQITGNIFYMPWFIRNSALRCLARALAPTARPKKTDFRSVDKRKLIIHRKLLHHVNFLRDEIAGYALNSIFLWNLPSSRDNRSYRDILYITGLYRNNANDEFKLSLIFNKRNFSKKWLFSGINHTPSKLQKDIMEKHNKIAEIARRKISVLPFFAVKRCFSVILQVKSPARLGGLAGMRRLIREIKKSLKYYLPNAVR